MKAWAPTRLWRLRAETSTFSLSSLHPARVLVRSCGHLTPKNTAHDFQRYASLEGALIGKFHPIVSSPQTSSEKQNRQRGKGGNGKREWYDELPSGPVIACVWSSVSSSLPQITKAAWNSPFLKSPACLGWSLRRGGRYTAAQPTASSHLAAAAAGAQHHDRKHTHTHTQATRYLVATLAIERL